MPLTIITIGKKHDSLLKDAIERYQTRLLKPFNLKWDILSHSSHEGDRARQEESERILARVLPNDIVCLLDERGRLLDSPTLSSFLANYLDQSRHIKIIIGGAYGVNEVLRKRANLVWSLSPLVFPHQLVRLILAEQIYRAQSIYKNQPYHND